MEIQSILAYKDFKLKNPVAMSGTVFQNKRKGLDGKKTQKMSLKLNISNHCFYKA